MAKKKEPKGLEVLGLIYLSLLLDEDFDMQGYANMFGDDVTVWEKAEQALRDVGYPELADKVRQSWQEYFRVSSG